ncbi:gamma-interferon inducible lysosomal thiol reductase gilt [Holotrichia oblita]|uniref:Gamma-interferon inducible lysosomal thiol reductase gilt n=1 Tax=Holotrichia oblita TaxID=644536 RepID=A0ACB9T9X9_HOLOL|nr:gamma-interferon inducible lysosomal thiol reductase gilt [Holotrichia oblita]
MGKGNNSKNRNAFYYFMLDFKNRQGQSFKSMVEVSDAAGPHWQRLSDKEKEKYQNLAKRNRENQTKQTSIAIDGDYFYLMHINEFCYWEKEDRSFPAEIALGKFNFQDGIVKEDVFHMLVQPGPLPLGYSAQVKAKAEETHQIQHMGSEDNTEEVLMGLISKLAEGGDEKYPTIYVPEKEVNMVQKVLIYLCNKFDHPYLFDINSLDYLFFSLKNNISPTGKVWPTASVSKLQLERDVYDYCSGIACATSSASMARSVRSKNDKFFDVASETSTVVDESETTSYHGFDSDSQVGDDEMEWSRPKRPVPRYRTPQNLSQQTDASLLSQSSSASDYVPGRRPASQCKINIDVFYESLCPDSLDFIRNQLSPAWNDIKPYVNLNLVPFGKTVIFNGGISFQCQHGPRECEGNRVMSCALQKIQDPSTAVHFVKCYMDHFMKYARHNRQEFGESCVTKVGLNWDIDVKQCYESQLGTLLQLNAGNHTRTYQPDFIPTIVYNNIFDQELQDESLHNFKGVACALIRKQHLQAC